MLALLLAWPLFLFGRPSYIPDSVSYLKGGKVAVEFVAGKPLAHSAPSIVIPPSAVAESNAAVSAEPVEEPKAARSIVYSVAAYLLRWPGNTMTALALAQLLAASFVCAVVAGASGVRTPRFFLLVGLVVAIATPLSVFAAFAVPDVLAGILIGAIVLFITALDRLSTGVRLVLAGIIGFAVAAHASIPPLAAGMMSVGALFFRVGPHFGLLRVRRAWAWLMIPPLLGFAATAAVGFVAFGEVSVAAKRFPFALARSVSDGPARWYLERQCTKPRYAVCEVFGTKIPKTVAGFLFEKESLNDRATPEQMNRIRAEETEIVIRAGLAYPATEVYGLSRSIVRQLFLYNLSITRFRDRVARDATGTPYLAPTKLDHRITLQIVELLTNIVLAFCLAWVAWAFNRLENRERATLLLVIAGLVGNAVICVIFSGLLSRYQARVIWVLPLFILSMAAARYRSSGGADRHVV